MAAQGVMRHQLTGHLVCEVRRQTPAHIDAREFGMLRVRVRFDLNALTLQIGIFSIGLRMDGNVLTRSH